MSTPVTIAISAVSALCIAGPLLYAILKTGALIHGDDHSTRLSTRDSILMLALALLGTAGFIAVNIIPSQMYINPVGSGLVCIPSVLIATAVFARRMRPHEPAS